MLGARLGRLSLFERALSVLTSVRPGEGRSVALIMLQVFLLMLCYYIVRPVRETLVLADGTPELRIYLVGAVAVTLMFLIPLYKMLFDNLDSGNGDRKRNAVLTWVSLFFASNMLIFAFLYWLDVDIAMSLYIWVGVFNVMVIAQFWAFAADLYNVKSGQRLFAVIVAGAALGAATGSQVAGRLYAAFGVSWLLLLAAAMLLLVVWLGRHVEQSVPEGSRRSAHSHKEGEVHEVRDVLSGFRVVTRSPYLLTIACFITLLMFINTSGGYILTTFLKAHATAVAAASMGVITEGEIIASFYGDYFATITLLQFVFQLFMVSRIFRWFGLKGAILVLPLLMMFSYGLIALVPVFALVRLLVIAENAAMYSIHNTANHALYLPVSRKERYVGKTTIDTFFYRFADLLVSGAVFVGSQLLGVEIGMFILFNVVLALALIALGTRIGQNHATEVRQNLSNLPPRIETPLPDVYIPHGQTLMFSVPDEAFMDPDPGDSLTYSARLMGEGRLPAWIAFDRHNQTFTARPPLGTEGAINVEVVATDFEGLSVCGDFTLSWGPDPLPRFSEAAEDAVHAG